MTLSRLRRCKMSNAWMIRVGYALALVSCLPGAMAQKAAAPAGRSGEQVYDSVCSACHGSGVAGAPKFKDAQAWKPLVGEGQAVLTGHAWVGVRAMPQKGGNPDLKLAEFSRAVAYMARGAGGDWTDPDAAMLRKIAREAEERLEKTIRDAQKMKRELHELGEKPR